MKTKALLLLTTAGFLAACGGSSTSSSGAGFAELGLKGANLVADWGDAAATPIGSMPTGTFNYSGVAGFNYGNFSNSYIASNAEAVADVNLQANFSSNTITGRITNFVDYTDTAGAGAIDLRNGVITGNGFSADATGTVTYLGTPLVAQGQIAGAFVGPNADALLGRIDGTWGGDTISGIIGAERQ